MNEFNTDWDPYEELMTHRHNIGELVKATVHSSELLRELGSRHKHQQEVIEQLMFQNRKLTNDLNSLRQLLESIKNSQNIQT